jgi:thiol:disulfide interchange protein
MDTIVRRLVLLMGLLLLSTGSALASLFLPTSGRGPNTLLLFFGFITLVIAAYLAHQLFVRPERIRGK